MRVSDTRVSEFSKATEVCGAWVDLMYWRMKSRISTDAERSLALAALRNAAFSCVSTRHVKLVREGASTIIVMGVIALLMRYTYSVRAGQ